MKGFVATEPSVLLRRAVLLTVFVLVSCFKQPDSAGTGNPGSTGGPGGPVAVTLSPRAGGLTLGQSLAITAVVANDSGTGGVSWVVSGSGGGLNNVKPTSATFSSTAPGSYTITATSNADPSKSASTTIGVTDLAGVFTNRHDSQRTGQNLQERALTLANVNASSFGKLFGCQVDAPIYGQPLYVANLAIPSKGTHNTVFVATMNNTVYAFDADDPSCAPRWTTSLLRAGETSVPIADTDPQRPDAANGNDLQGSATDPVGVMGTPVIDPATNTLYVVSKTRESVTAYHQRLHALSLLDGTDKLGGPAEINDSITVPGNADQGDGTTCTASPNNVPFCALLQGQRPALLLANGNVYVVWASHDDVEPFHGWVIGFNASDLSQPPAAVFNTTPNSQTYPQANLGQAAAPHAMGGIWQAGTGPAADAFGNIYVGTGNGAFDGAATWGDSFLRLTPTLSLASTCGAGTDPCFFTPFNEQALAQNDTDLDSGGPMLLPDSAGSAQSQHLLVGGDKQGILYLLDRDNMGQFMHATGGTDDSLQQVKLQTIPGGCTGFCGVFSTPSYWQGNIYLIAVNDVLKRLPIADAVIDVANVNVAGDVFKFPGAQTVISSNGAADGIVWALATDQNGTHGKGLAPTVLFAYNAVTLQKLYSSSATLGDPTAAGTAVKFQVPTVANGKVYIGTHGELSVFGLLP